jgi:hypothetical protein
MVGMRKKAIILSVALVLVVAIASIELCAMGTTEQAQKRNKSFTSTGPSVKRNDSVNTTEGNGEVVLEGNLTGPYGFVCEVMPPWNYELQTSEGIVYVFWDHSEIYNSVSVRIYGSFTNGTITGCPYRMPRGELVNGTLHFIRIPDSDYYYFKAERIELL